MIKVIRYINKKSVEDLGTICLLCEEQIILVCRKWQKVVSNILIFFRRVKWFSGQILLLILCLLLRRNRNIFHRHLQLLFPVLSSEKGNIILIPTYSFLIWLVNFDYFILKSKMFEYFWFRIHDMINVCAWFYFL